MAAISFSCPSCGLKIKCKQEHAGKATKCPTCKQPLTVPLPSATAPWTPPQQIDGEESSLDQAGVDGGVTLDQGRAGGVSPRSSQRTIGEALAKRKNSGERYVIEGEIARGGMGAVLRAVDGDLRREVAVKYMLDEKDPKKKARFIEEAQINAQLEHPNIVPVYDLRIDAQQRPYLMMKMVKGRDLKAVLDQLRAPASRVASAPGAEKEYTLGRLLNILVNICNGLAFAHAHGVVHRDLKPANIMLGDFGEVYIMDWGLAKVLKGDGASRLESGTPVATPGSTNISAKRSSQVATNREGEADLTQEGSILGTPVYMPPEQANGDLKAIDQRSDVYSLGAILYEMLTLQPPIDKEGGYMAILVRVLTGEIVPPEERVRRAGSVSARSIPPELSAIAMKALAKESKDRYQNVEALRKDIERFQEGRSVSAKQDTTREMLWKVVKRNKAVSFVLTVALVFVVFIWAKLSWANYQARLKTDEAYATLKTQTADAVPAMIRAAQLAINERQFDDAFKQAQLALSYAPDNADATLLAAQVLMVRQDFAKACVELERYLKYRPSETDAKELLQLCRNAKRDDVPALLAISRVFYRQQHYALVDGLLSKYGKNSLEARNQILQMYRDIIEKSWKEKGAGLQIDATGLQLNIDGFSQVVDLSPLRGMPLTSLSLEGCAQVRDVSPLQGIPLNGLSLRSTQVQDLTPLKGMPLTSLGLAYTRVSDLTPLKGMPLTSLDLSYTSVSDLTPLKGMPLTTLGLVNAGVTDLTPLKGMPLTALSLFSAAVTDLTPLAGMKLGSVLLPPKVTRGMPELRKMATLQTINSTPAAEFWRDHDAGKYKGTYEP